MGLDAALSRSTPTTRCSPTSTEEHRRARAIPGMDDALLARAIAHGHTGAFRR
jgi:hypothetical protein